MLKPLRDKILIEKEEKKETTESGIILVSNTKDGPQTGKVVAVGSGILTAEGTSIALEVVAGDIVMYAKYTGIDMKVEGKDHILLSEADILAIVDKQQ